MSITHLEGKSDTPLKLWLSRYSLDWGDSRPSFVKFIFSSDSNFTLPPFI